MHRSWWAVVEKLDNVEQVWTLAVFPFLHIPSH